MVAGEIGVLQEIVRQPVKQQECRCIKHSKGFAITQNRPMEVIFVKALPLGGSDAERYHTVQSTEHGPIMEIGRIVLRRATLVCRSVRGDAIIHHPNMADRTVPEFRVNKKNAETDALVQYMVDGHRGVSGRNVMLRSVVSTAENCGHERVQTLTRDTGETIARVVSSTQKSVQYVQHGQHGPSGCRVPMAAEKVVFATDSENVKE